MAALTQRLHYQTDEGETGSATIYSESDQCPQPRLCVSTEAGNGYVKLGNVDDANATPLRVQLNSDGKTYAVLTDAYTDAAIYNMLFIAAAINELQLEELEPDLSMTMAFSDTICNAMDVAETTLTEK